MEDDHEGDVDDDVPSSDGQKTDEENSDDIGEKMPEASNLRKRVKKSTAAKI